MISLSEPLTNGSWIRSFLHRRSALVAAAAIVIAALRIASTYPEIGITYDEPAHIACGLQFLSQHVYRYEAQHPPLARIMCALLPFLAGVRPEGRDDMTEEGVRILYQGKQVTRNLALDRFGTLPFFVLACVTVYLWGSRYLSPTIGALATVLFTLTPVVLAHGGLGTTDMALTASLGAEFLILLAWSTNPSTRNALWLGLGGGITVLAKFTSLLFFPAAAVVALVFYMAVRRPRISTLTALARERVASLALAAFVAALVVHAGYFFSFGQVPGWDVWLPAPEFFQGIREVLEHNQWGHPSFFLGEFSRGGWWDYFPVMILFKTPTALLLLFGIGLFVCWKKRRDLSYIQPLAFLIGVLLPAMLGRIDIGTRHVMPIYITIALLGGIGLQWLLDSPGITRKIVAILLPLELLVSVALCHPDYLSYTNEFVRRPENLFVDSDYDWGQGTVLLARRLRELHTSSVTTSFWYLTPEQLRVWPGLEVNSLDYQHPAKGWTAVSPTYWRLFGMSTHNPDMQNPWFAGREPVERIGGMLLYYVSP